MRFRTGKAAGQAVVGFDALTAPLFRIYDIPAHLPFLDCLAAGVLREVPGDAPERLSRVTILLPTRRSARALRTAFLRAGGAEGGGGE